jgi:hypothetical protein
MIRKSGYRFSEKIMLKQDGCVRRGNGVEIGGRRRFLISISLPAG